MFQRSLPPLTLNLIIINVVMFVLPYFGINNNAMVDAFALHYFEFSTFKPLQIFTHMFMHAGFMHLFFNMLGLYMFGGPLEERLGPQRFLLLYMSAGFGAAILQTGVHYFELRPFIETYGFSEVQSAAEHTMYLVGASGALFGLLAGYGILFAEQEMFLMFFPMPIKAKYFVMIYGVAELLNGIGNRPGDHVAHFAHVGGAIFGFLLIRYWKSKTIL